MKRRSAFSRIALLNEGREAFLNYLRNITPQAILLSFSLLATYKSLRSPQHEIGLKFIALSFFAIFAVAWYANTTIFHRECIKHNIGRFSKRIHKLCETMSYSHAKRAKIVALLMFKHKKIELIEQACIAVILQATLVAIFLLAADSYLHMASTTK